MIQCTKTDGQKSKPKNKVKHKIDQHKKKCKKKNQCINLAGNVISSLQWEEASKSEDIQISMRPVVHL